LNKSETALKYGEDQVQVWRRSFDISPPLLDIDDERHPKFNKKFKHIENLPLGESLKDVTDRIRPFWKRYINNISKTGGNHLIVAHSNSLRAIIKILEKLSSEEIISINIPTGVPLVFTFNSTPNTFTKEYLINEEELEMKKKLIENQGKVKK
jgi:2,3-bisphosphoglycerate-dependent phosphoglycerate mutase